MRQALGSPPPSSTSAWLASPDLLPFCAPAGDAGLLTARYDTGFAQAPVPAQPNQVYVRAKNTGTGAQSATAYLYWAEHDPLAGIFDNFLTPQNWLSTGFTVTGKTTNAVSVQAANANDVVLGSSPLAWTPTTLSSEVGHYVLIAWLDTGGNPPPDFTKLPAFASLDKVRQYVEGLPNLVMLDTAYSGFFSRQYQDQEPAISAADATWNSAPDLVVYAGQPAYDATLLERALNWSVHQPPINGGQNNLYVRGINASTGSLNARVSFYYAVNNPAASPNPLLDPKTWKSDAMTWNGKAQNHVDLTSNAGGDQMLNQTPVVWQPAAPAAGTYAVIAWIDNTGGSSPPPFASLPAFSSLGALGEYVQGVRNLVMWDGEYDGLFVRQAAGQTASQPGTGAQTSPDIISAGVAPAQDAGAYATSAAYNSATVANAVATGVPNFIYLRVINPNNRAQRARVYLFLGDNAAPSLSALSNAAFTVAGETRNWVDLSADTQNQVLVSTVPIVWMPPAPATASSQQFLLTYVDGSANPQPPDFSTVGYGQLSAVKMFVATQPQLSWMTVKNTPPTPAPTFTTQFSLLIDHAGTYYVGTKLENMPGDGTLTVDVPGPDAADTIVASSFHPPAPNAAVLWAATYPAGFKTSIVISYWQGATTPKQAKATSLVLPSP